MQQTTQLTRQVTYNKDTKLEIYKYYLYDIFLVGQASTVTKNDMLYIAGLSTINFRCQQPDTIELKDFAEYKNIYERNRSLIEHKWIDCHGIGTEILANIIGEAKNKNKNTINLLATSNSCGFYQKVCNRFIADWHIKGFSISHSYNLEIRF